MVYLIPMIIINNNNIFSTKKNLIPVKMKRKAALQQRKQQTLWGTLDKSSILQLSLWNENYLILLVFFFTLGLSSAGPGVTSKRSNIDNSNNNYYSSSISAATHYELQEDSRSSDRASYNNHFQGNQFPRRTSASYENNNKNNNNSNDHHNSYYHNVLNLNLTFLQDFELACPRFCAEQAQFHDNEACINRGCKQWRTGLRESCSSVCQGTEGNFRENYGCQVGCTKAIEDYYFRITGLLGTVDPPTLVSDSLNSTSLQLSWEGSSPQLPYLVFTIQRRLHRRMHQWETISTQPLNQTWFTVQGLTPYTEYQFRIGWILAQDFPPFYSQESNPIKTQPEGLPNPPQITSIQPISNTSVSITWIPPSQPNGRLVAYILTLRKLPDGNAIIKEIPMVHNPRGYTFSGLSPNTNYSLSISAQNQEGVGNATNTFFVTPQSSMSNDMSKRPEPRLLLQGLREVYLQQTDLLLGPDVTVYAPGQNVSAIAAHTKYKWVFIATVDGQVVRTSLDKNETVIIFPRRALDVSIMFMSVDWLHNKLFLLGRMGQSSHWVIKRCELGGEDLVTIYPFLGGEPIDFHADPFTGYVYWVSRPSARINVSSLYKMDMLSENSKPIPVLEVENGELGPFTIDFATYRILVVQKTLNTVLSVSLDGDKTDIRQNTQRPQFRDALSIGMYNGLLYWTTGKTVVVEEYSSRDKIFYQNSFDVPKVHQPCTRLMIIHPDLQPVPVPMAPPQMPQVVMGTRQARVSWRPPAVIAGLGKDAWTSWKYRIILSDNSSISAISGTQYLLQNLQPSASYSIQVQAYSPSGYGPPSASIKGTTLRETLYNISLLWASGSGIYDTDVLGDNVQQLVSAEQWSVGSGRYTPYVSSVAWHTGKSLYYALSNGSVYYYNAEGSVPKITRVRGVSYAQSIAYDYIGQKLYWSNPKRQMVLRCSVGGCDNSADKMEWLRIVTMAKEIAIDSLKGTLVWNTGHSLEASKLNGYHPIVLYQTGLFSGVQIQGFTLDGSDHVYFVTRSSSGSVLRQLTYDRRGRPRPVEIARFNEINLLGPMTYFNNRLLCLYGSSQSMLMDVTGNSRATLTLESISNVTALHIRDEYERRLPNGIARNEIQVVPNSVPAWTVKVNGKWDNFTISWQNVTNVNMGKLYYEVVLNNTVTRFTSNPNITITKDICEFQPFSEIEIAITAVSYWAYSEPVIVKRQTPSARPSEPRNVRVFTEKLSPVVRRARMVLGNNTQGTTNLRDDTVVAELRWDPPAKPNGKILDYVLSCWKDGVKSSNCTCLVNKEQLSCQLRNLPRNSTYSFAVQAVTVEGQGNVSTNVTTNLEYDYPVEKMLLTTADNLQIFDVDRNAVQPLRLGVLNPISSVYSAIDNAIYWINAGQDLMKYDLDTGNKTRIVSLSGEKGEKVEASHLAFDWIGRRLFWEVEYYDREPKFGIMALDLTSVENMKNAQAIEIISSETAIKGLTVNPFTSMILWTTSKIKGITMIYSARTNYSNPVPFLSKDTKCNCSNLNTVGEPITFDSTGFDSIKRGILITNEKSIYMADEYGCECLPLINMTAHGFSWSRTPPYTLVGNRRHIFWSAGYVYASTKPGSGVTELLPSGVREISLLGPSAQPYPGVNCLVPAELEPKVPALVNLTSYSLHLRLPAARFTDCEHKNISMATLKYYVYYGTVNENSVFECTKTSLSKCTNVTTSRSLLQINDLDPYVMYTVFVYVTNTYREMAGLQSLSSQETVFRTAAGAPMPPKLLRVEPLTPNSVRVVWRRPVKLNGAKVWYEIGWDPEEEFISPGPGWTKEKALGGQEWYHSTNNDSVSEFHWTIGKLHPGCNYFVWVSAFSEKGDAFKQSQKMKIRTYSNPNNVTLLNATPHVLNLTWNPPTDGSIIRHQIYYRVGWESKWNWTEPMETAKLLPPYNFSISELKPKTVYGFKVKAWYGADPKNPYYWPKDQSQFMIETLTDKPGAPGMPIARNIGRDLYEVEWERADDNGGKVEMYSLECRMDVEIISRQGDGKEKMLGLAREKRQSGNEVISQKQVGGKKQDATPVKYARWVQVYNGSETRWQVENLDVSTPYAFRVRAKNHYGWGEYSKVRTVDSLTLLGPGLAEPQPLGIILGTVASSLVILAVFGSVLLLVYQRKVKKEPTLQSPSSSERREVELATLRELPGGSSFIHQSNILYAASELILDLELAGVAQIGRNQISFTKFLGSGAFGEVYEGSVIDLHNSDDTRVAIKTLRKGASTNEKLEFIQEAKLMTQFRHPHILQLLGICVDTDPCCLLLELMDGGDLLSYLRSNRPHLGSSVVLRMSDLLKMCVDVAKGCVYLEEMHFVHRDLAARNCLVRLMDPPDGTGDREGQERVVKIGDFGLARDVYRNDYYRKEGEGLLPVRWMAPESLIDGVYTTQSDVWAFGVLLWEIMTLGQQPYPARNNLEVLHYVRNGGRLQQPPRCPPRLSELMLRCWEFNADNRPTFKDCLLEVELILRDYECVMEQGDHISTIESTILQLHQYNNYLQPSSETKSGYYRQVEDGLYPAAINSAYSTSMNPHDNIIYADTGSGNGASFPKYLEIVSDTSVASEQTQPTSLPFSTTDDGYEIPLPRKPPRNPKLVSRPTRQNIPSDLGLPSPSYWNTMPVNQSIFQQEADNCPIMIESDPSVRSLQLNNVQYEPESPAKAKDKYIRRTTEGVGYSQLDSPSYFRNLLASTTSEDVDMDGEMDYCEGEFGSPTSAGNVFRDYDNQEGLQNGIMVVRPRKTRFPVSLSDSSNGSGDTSACMDDGARSCESNETDLRSTDNPEYLSTVPSAGNSFNGNSRMNNINNNCSKSDVAYLDERRHREFLGNGFIYDDAIDMSFAASGDYSNSGRSRPLLSYQHSHSISGSEVARDYLGSDANYGHRHTLKMGKTNSG